jgi:membrane protein implicated in regulation of membrane protease activity
MLAFYILMGLVGGGLILLSAFGGHDHAVDHAGADFDGDLAGGHDLHIEPSHHGDVPASDIWLPFLSLRFWTYFAALTGVLGTLLTLLTELSPPIIAILSFGIGAVSGLSVAYAIRYLQLSESDSSVSGTDLLGADARVTVPIRPGSEGKIRCTVKGETIDLLAVSDGDATLPVGADVVIVALEGATARVEPKGNMW